MQFDIRELWRTVSLPCVRCFRQALRDFGDALQPRYDPWSDPSLTDEEALAWELEQMKKEDQEVADLCFEVFDRAMMEAYRGSPEFREDIAAISEAAGRLDGKNLEAARLIEDAYDKHSKKGFWGRLRDNNDLDETRNP